MTKMQKFLKGCKRLLIAIVLIWWPWPLVQKYVSPDSLLLVPIVITWIVAVFYGVLRTLDVKVFHNDDDPFAF